MVFSEENQILYLKLCIPYQHIIISTLVMGEPDFYKYPITTYLVKQFREHESTSASIMILNNSY